MTHSLATIGYKCVLYRALYFPFRLTHFGRERKAGFNQPPYPLCLNLEHFNGLQKQNNIISPGCKPLFFILAPSHIYHLDSRISGICFFNRRITISQEIMVIGGVRLGAWPWFDTPLSSTFLKPVLIRLTGFRVPRALTTKHGLYSPLA